jgi:hypothetical protein
MIRYEDFLDLGKMGTFIGQLKPKAFVSIETLIIVISETGMREKYRVWYWRL